MYLPFHEHLSPTLPKKLEWKIKSASYKLVRKSFFLDLVELHALYIQI